MYVEHFSGTIGFFPLISKRFIFLSYFENENNKHKTGSYEEIQS